MKKTNILISILFICISLTACQFVSDFADNDFSDKSMDFKLSSSSEENEEDTDSYIAENFDNIVNGLTNNKSNHENDFNSEDYSEHAFALINDVRKVEGLPAFETDFNLVEAAMTRAIEISQEGHFSNIRPNRENWSTINDEFYINYSKSSENILSGYSEAEDLINDLINSGNAKESILSDNFNKLGVGVHKTDESIYWELLFINDESFAPIPKEEYAKEVLRLTNIERENAGLSALTGYQELVNAADKRSEEVIKLFDHVRPDGRSIYTVFEEYGVNGYKTAGENIASGQTTPEEVVNGWMNSPGHRENILNSDFNKMGVGVYHFDGVIYWTQLFTD